MTNSPETPKESADEALAEMRRVSELIDETYGTSEYQTHLVALALTAREYLRRLPAVPPPAVLRRAKRA